MPKFIKSKATGDGRDRSPFTIFGACLLLGTTSLLALAAPASAADLSVNGMLKDYLNKNTKQSRSSRQFITGKNAQHWKVESVKVASLRAPAVEIWKKPADYTILAVKSAALCPDPTRQPGSVSQTVNFSETVKNRVSATKSSSVTDGTSASVSVTVKYGSEASPLSGEATAGLTVNHSKTKGESKTVFHEVSKTIAESMTITMSADGGKYAVLWARQNDHKNIPYTAEFEPKPNDMVTFNLVNTGQTCLFADPKYEGKGVCFGPGDKIGHFKGWNMNDETESVMVAPEMKARFYQHSNFRGKSWYVGGNHPKLHGWLNRSFTSVVVDSGRLTVKVPYSHVKKGLPIKLHKFKVTGKVTAKTTQSRTLVTRTNMSATDYKEVCDKAGVVKLKRKPGASPVVVKKVAAAKLKKLKFKAPKSTGKRKMMSAPAPK